MWESNEYITCRRRTRATRCLTRILLHDRRTVAKLSKSSRVNNGSMGQWVKWVSFLDGSYGSWVDALSPMTHLHIMHTHFSAFNARRIITSQRHLLFPETVEALSIVLEGYRNKLLQ